MGKYCGQLILASAMLYIALAISPKTGHAQPATSPEDPRVTAAEQSLARSKEALDSQRLSSTCRKATTTRLIIRVNQGMELDLLPSPHRNDSRTTVKLPSGSVIRETSLQPDGGFRCISIPHLSLTGWITVDLFEKIKATPTKVRIENEDPFREIVECSAQTRKSKSIFESLLAYGTQIKNYQGCEKKPENSFSVSEELQIDIELQLNSLMLATTGPRCSQLYADTIDALRAYLTRIRSEFPNCGQRSKTELRYEVKENGANPRVNWIEGASADIIPGAGQPAWSEISLLDRVGEWGYFKLDGAKSAKYGWIKMSLVRPMK